jgi:hypothetical protein
LSELKKASDELDYLNINKNIDWEEIIKQLDLDGDG